MLVFAIGCYMCSILLAGHLTYDVYVYKYYVIIDMLMSLFVSYNITTSSL